MVEFVAYYRVSTQRQGATGLGLDAQKSAVQSFVRGVSGQLIGEYEEVESGAARVRPKLNQAIQVAAARKATLVIAKLDRLARNVHFISRLMESGVEFVATDLPYANKLTVHIIAAVAEYEREMIGKRTKAALQQAKMRGVLLGNPNAGAQARYASQAAAQNADAFARGMSPHLRAATGIGVTSHSAVARLFNQQGIRTQRGRQWTAAGVANLKAREVRLRPS
jgi:DNA invertase Pin-like site-specific DNA recombinase